MIDKEMEYEVNDRRDIIVHFTANWSQGCQAMDRDMQDLAHYVKDRVIVLKCDVDANRDIAKEYEADRDDDIPLVVAIRDTKVIEKLVKPDFKAIESLILELANLN